MFIDHSDSTALEAALEATPLGTIVRVRVPDGEVFEIHRVPGGWYLPGDVVIASADVADGEPTSVEVVAR